MSNGLFDEDPNTKLTGLETLFGNVAIPSLAKNRKQLIDAAILVSSLELLKPRQQGENFASQATRALGAGMDFGKNYADYVSKLGKGKTPSQLSMTEWKWNALLKIGDQLIESNPDFQKIVETLQSNSWPFVGQSSDDVIEAIAANAASIQSANPKLTNHQSMLLAAQEMSKSNIKDQNSNDSDDDVTE